MNNLGLLNVADMPSSEIVQLYQFFSSLEEKFNEFTLYCDGSIVLVCLVALLKLKP